MCYAYFTTGIIKIKKIIFINTYRPQKPAIHWGVRDINALKINQKNL